MITANEAPVLAMRLTLPAIGLWVCSLDVESEEALVGALTIAQRGFSYAGFVVRAGVVAGRCQLEAVGGSGGIATGQVTARSYNDATVRTVLSDILSDVGEVLDAGGSTRAVLATKLPFWTRSAGRPGAAISALAQAVGARWRVLSSGQIWFGTETWPDVTDTFESLELDRASGAGSVLLAADSIELIPGVTLRGQRVGRVEHTVGSGPLRTTFWTE